MTDAELTELLRDSPTLYHMAEQGSWPKIRRHGLLSTSALLDLDGIGGAAREALEARRRPERVTLRRDGLENTILRDQKPMDDAGLDRCLQGGLSPADWYRLLNGKAFFWLSLERLMRLMRARPYRGLTHDVLELDAASLVAVYRDRITLSAINSGATRPFPVRRGPDTFATIGRYPYATWRAKRPRGDRVVELAVEWGVLDVARFVRRVARRDADDRDETLFAA